MAAPKTKSRHVYLFVGFALGASLVMVLFVRGPGRTLSASELNSKTHVRPPIPAQTMRFSCDGRDVPLGMQWKTIREGDWELAVALEPACLPAGDFIFSVSATAKEFLAVTGVPQVQFRITKSGNVRDAKITHSSGSNELDARILAALAHRRFKSDSCGECEVEATVSVDF
jgi:TonB family protein